MTDITPKPDILTKVNPSPVSKVRPLKPGSGSLSFSTILMEELGGLDPSQGIAQDESTGLPELSATRFAASLAADTTSKVSQQVLAAVDGLETYAQWLSDPDKTLRQAASLLDGIESGLTDMDLESGTDPALKRIVDHLSTLVAVEKVKLNRGDYI